MALVWHDMSSCKIISERKKITLTNLQPANKKMEEDVWRIYLSYFKKGHCVKTWSEEGVKRKVRGCCL